jgi:hypothetical protein
VDAGWLAVSHLGPLHVIFARHGTIMKLLGVVPEAPTLSDAGLMQAYEKRCPVEQGFQDHTPLLGLGQDQNRPYGAAVTHLHRMCFAYALLTHMCLERYGAQGRSTRKKAADLSTAVAQDQLRGLRWEDLITYWREKRHGQPVIEELERLRVAYPEKVSQHELIGSNIPTGYQAWLMPRLGRLSRTA